MDMVAYCRVSTNKEDQLNSLEMQKELFEAYARKNGYNLIDIYADEGISGTKTKNRTQFNRMMKDAREKRFDILATKDVSRFARNTLDFLERFRELKRIGIDIDFLTYNMQSMGNSEMVITMLAAVAQEESANISKRVKQSKKHNAEKGKVPNFCYGYDKIPGDYFNLTINIEESKIVKEIYDMYTIDCYGANKIANILNSRGLKTKRGCNWSQNAICRILTNEIYIGQVINCKEEVEDFLTSKRKENMKNEWMITENKSLQIIDNIQYAQANRLMESRKDSFTRNKEKTSTKHIFSKMIKCANCGYSFRRIERSFKSGKYVKWGCSGRNSLGKDFCNNTILLDEDDMITFINEYFRGISQDEDRFIMNMNSEFEKHYKDRDENVLTEKQLKRDLSEIEKTRNKYQDMYVRDLISIDELETTIKPLKFQKERIENQLRIIEHSLTKNGQLNSIIKDSFKDIQDIVVSNDISNKSLRKVIENVVVDKEGNVDIYLKVIDKLLN